MKEFKTKLSSTQIKAIIGGELQHPHPEMLCKVSEAQEADAQTVIFLEQEALFDKVLAAPAGLVITSPAFAERLAGKPLLVVERPYLSLMTLVHFWLMQEDKDRSYAIHPSAVIAGDVRYEGEVSIAPGVVIGEGCVLGKGVVIEAGCTLGRNVFIGAGSKLMPGVHVYNDCVIGRNCLLHSGVVIGADGFGFMLLDGKQQKIPQVGNVVIGNDVEIGANTCIDRATLGSTRVGDGSKLDNLVQVGHNCTIGKHCILCSQVGLAGGTTLGDYVYLAGQVGAAGHLKIGNRAMVGAQSGLVSDIPDDGKFFGSPAMDAGLQKRIYACQKSLPDIYRTFSRLRKEASGKQGKE